jgi:hypothetical protein
VACPAKTSHDSLQDRPTGDHLKTVESQLRRSPEVSAVVDGDTKMECVLQPIKDVTVRERAVRVSTVPDVIGLLLAGSWGLYQASAARWEESAVFALMLLSLVVLFIGIGRLREAALRFLEDRKDRT